MQSQYDDELKWTDDDIRQLREAVVHLVEINEELNSRCIMYDTIVKQREAALKKAKIYIEQLEMALTKPQQPNWN
jgi:hypothetical protein